MSAAFRRQVRACKGQCTSSGRSSAGSTKLLRNSVSRRRCAARVLAVRVEANELNKWADTSGGDEDAGTHETHFEVEVAQTVSRVLTAKAVQHILGQLGETNLTVCQWFNNFAADNPPIQGDDFVLALMQQKPLTKRCNTTGAVVEINPAQLGERVLKMREGLAVSVSKVVPTVVGRRNVSVLRKHLENTSYISGSLDNKQEQRRRAGSSGRRRGAL